MKKTLAIMLALIMVLALVPTVAFAEEPKKIYVDAKNGDDSQEGVGTTSDKAYKSLDKAMEAAGKEATIYLAAGTYCGNSANPSEKGKGAGKNLTFVGAGSDKTTWQIRATKKYGSDGWCDYSFDGSDRITFEKMTVVGSVYPDGTIKANDCQGFVRIKHVTLKDCTFNGRADYWGYETTTFENVTFNAPGTSNSGITDINYSLWTWTGTEYTFNNCTFNSAGKVINAYRGDGGSAADNPIVLNFKDCNVVSSAANKSVLNIKDANNYYTVNISGTNTVEGLKPNDITCSRLFQVEGWADNYNLSGGAGNNKNCQATVTIDGKTVWENGRMVGHAIDTKYDKYTDGYKDNAFEIKANTTTGFGFVRICKYCGYTEASSGELYNDIGLDRTVKQNNGVVSEDSPSSNKYKVANTSGITVDYTATMDMENLEWRVGDTTYNKDNKYKYIGQDVSPWKLLEILAKAEKIDDKTEVILTFKFDDKIDLAAFEKKYNNAVTASNQDTMLKLTSNMFKIADGGVTFDPAKDAMTIKCKWNRNDAATDEINPIITLNGYGLPVTDNWGGSKIDITNSGCVKGMVHINPMGGAVAAMVEPGSNVAANVQVQNTTPPEISPTIQIPIVGGCKTDEFTLYYGGGSSGDSSGSSSGGGYYHPTTTPVPVIVIPPKTGDMTVWQSILHFLGIR